MQSIFRLPWCSEQIGPKVSDRAALEKMRGTPVVEIPVLNKLKRKRIESPEGLSPSRTQEAKKPRSEEAPSPLQLSVNARPPAKTDTKQTFTQTPAKNSGVASQAATGAMESTQSGRPFAQSISSTYRSGISTENEQTVKSTDPAEAALTLDAPKPAAEDVMGLTPLQQMIENEFNMQILMKHNELRLIEQELAKCQIALEQLRRCELQPYPGSDRPYEAVSTGTGPSILPPPGYTQPSHPAPYGVTDGPYSRHYRQWLLHDPQFDSVPVQADGASRPTRNSGSARKSISKQYTFPSRPADPLQSIPNYPAVAPKDKASPLVLRRSTDGQLVKLICNNCLRGNFSSIQGFLNHCRIAHKVDYKSHDAAAIDCGRLLDENEAANLPPETHHTPVPKLSVSRASTANSTPLRNYVHPFNTAAGASMAFSNGQRMKPAARKPVPSLSSAAPSAAGSPLTPSPQVPRLSAQFAKYQLGGDLAKATASAKQKIDLGVDEDPLSPDASEQESPLEPAAGSRTVAGAHAGMMMSNGMNARPPSRKGFRQPMQQRPRPSPLVPAPGKGVAKQEHREIPGSPQDQALNLSPHTADSNPGLVSDDEDDGSASEEETAPQAEMRRPLNVGGTTCADHMEIDVAVDDDIDESGVIIRRHSMFGEDERGLRTAGSPSRKLGMNKRGA